MKVEYLRCLFASSDFASALRQGAAIADDVCLSSTRERLSKEACRPGAGVSERGSLLAIINSQ